MIHQINILLISRSLGRMAIAAIDKIILAHSS